MSKALLVLHKLKKLGPANWLAVLAIVLTAWLVMSADAQGWPTNSLDSVSGKNYCTNCHRQASGTLTINGINGQVPLLKNRVVVTPGSFFTMEFNTKGLGYNRFAVAGAIKVPDTGRWTASIGPTWSQNGKSGATTWTIAAQNTAKGSPDQSPYMLVTNFSAASPLNQTGVTKDDGSASDLNALAHDETFTVKVNVDSSVTPGIYTLYVQGIGSDSASRLAYNQQEVTVYVTGDATAPAAPATVNVVYDTGVGSKMNISWSQPGDADLAGYYLYRSTDDSVYQEIYKITDKNILGFTDTNLKQNTLYYYKVASYDTSGNISGFSPVASNTTSNTARNDTEAPPKVTDLRALAVSGKVYLSWSASTHGDIQAYRIYRSTTPGNFNFSAPYGSVANNTYEDTGVTNGQYYYYVIKAADVDGNVSVKSNMVSAVPAPFPGSVATGAVQPHGMYSTNENLCQYCHNTHTASGDALMLKSLMSETCYTCHDGTQSQYNVKTQFDITANPSHHKVPEGRLDCADCHAPHDNPTTNPRILKGKRESKANPQYNPDKSGYILNWLLLGTWASNPDGTLTGTEWVSESAIAPKAGDTGGGKTWKAYASTNANSNGFVDLRAAGAFGAVTNSEGYAFTYIYSSYTRKAHLHVGGDDGVKVYLNGLLLLTNNKVRDYQTDEDEIYNVTLFKGWNRLLLKVSQDSDTSWGFGVRFHDHEKNKPITDVGVDLSGYWGQSLKTASNGNSYCWVCHGSDSILGDPYGDHQTYFTTSNKHNSSPKMPNPASGTGIKCVNCHETHGSANAPLLKGANTENYCIDCHVSKGFNLTRSYMTEPGGDTGIYSEVPNSSNYFAGTNHDTAFYFANGCLMCHDPHGTYWDTVTSDTYKKMLVAPLRKSRVNSGTGNGGTATHDVTGPNQELCFRCHDQRYYYNNNTNPIVGSKFGNGQGRNLHWHVTDFNLSCRTCHDPHSSNNQRYHNTTIGTQTGGQLNNPENVNFDWSIDNNSIQEVNGKIQFISTGTSNGKSTGYSCYMQCGENHNPKTYSRNATGAPGVSCISCHSTEEFRKNSKHPFLKPGKNSGLSIKCETCHIPDHSLHSSSNPKGLNINTTVAWTYNDGVSTVTENVYFANSSKQFCWTCHGNPTTRSYGTVRMKVYNSIGDHESKFDGKPHSTLERQGTANPYGAGNDMPCMECHVYHGSSNTNLLKSVIDGTPIDASVDEGKINACMACHDGLYGSRPMANIKSLYNAAKYPGHYFKGTKAKLLCTECHSPHGTSNPVYILAGPQPSGANFPIGMATMDVRRVCNSCHPYSDETNAPVYISDTGRATMYPLPSSIVEHASTSNASCALCHDPHKPWPATGSNGICYTCHGNGGDAEANIEKLMGTTTGSTTKGQQTGIVSFHKIFDATTPNTNDCMSNCHTAHPHDPRADHIPGVVYSSGANNEKEMCLKCHDSGTTPALDRGQPKISSAKYANKPHDYTKTTKMFNDGSKFQGNCIKCHEPHGSSNTYLLRWKNGDSLCTQCHNGATTDGNGAVISNIKTLYDRVGHYYKADSTKKLRCDECHIPHGSSNVKYLRDDSVTKAKNADNSIRPFPQNMDALTYNSRNFCTTCHMPNDGDGTGYNYNDAVREYTLYESDSGPTVPTKIYEVPVVTEHGLTMPEHLNSDITPCTECHNPHDPRPVGSKKDCMKCHGNTGYAYNIQALTGIQEEVSPGVYNDFVGRSPSIQSSHRIWDGYTEWTNTCMTNCHQPHVHNPRADLIKDRRVGTGDITPPGNPTGLSATAKGTSRVDLQWSAPADIDVLGYYVYSSTNGTSYSLTGVTGNTSFIDGGLTPNTTVYYRVYAYDKAGNISTQSTPSPVSATPSLAGDTSPPTTPTNLAITAKTSSSIKLAWTASTDNVEVRGYKIYRSTDGTTYTLLGYTGETTFTDGGLAPNSTYYYKVSAYDSQTTPNESGQTTPVSDKTLTTLNTSSGSYTNGTDTLEFFLGTTKTTSFSPGDTVKVKLTTTRLVNVANRRDTEVYNYLGTRLNRYTTATVTKTTSPYEIETTFPAPATPGVYTIRINWTDNGNRNINTYETIVVGSTIQFIKTYKDSNRTQETRDFHLTNGDNMIYIKAFATQGVPDLTRSSWTFGNWQSGTDTGSFTSVTMSGDYALYAINLNDTNLVTKSDGNWYYIGGLIRNSAGTTLSSLYYQIRYQPRDTTAPNAPGVPSSTGKTDKTISLSWTASSSTDVAGYNIYRQVGAGYYKVGVATGTTFTDKGLNPNTSYNYRVTAFDAAGNESTTAQTAAAITTNAEVADTTKPSTPTGFNAIGNGAVILTWTASSDNIGVAGYIIYRSADGGVSFLKAGATSDTSFTDTGLLTAKPYTYYVVAYDAAGNLSTPTLKVTATEHSTTSDSVERALCMTCHDGTGANVGLGLDASRTTGPSIGTAYNNTKHNVDKLVDTFDDGSEYFGNCTKCHEPHGSQFTKLLKWENTNQLCYQCHTNASSSGKYGGKRDFEMSVHGVTSEPGDVQKAVWSVEHSAYFSDHFGTDGNWDVTNKYNTGINSIIKAEDGHLKNTLYTTSGWAYAYAETNSGFSIDNGITLSTELDLPNNPVDPYPNESGIKGTKFISDIYITASKVASQTDKNPANGSNWVRIRYEQSTVGAVVYVDNKLTGSIINRYTGTPKNFAGKTRNVRLVLTPNTLQAYDGPTLLANVTSGLGLPGGSTYYVDFGGATNTTEELTNALDDFKWHDNTKGMRVVTKEGGYLRGGWKVEAYESPGDTLLDTVTTSTVADSTYGKGTRALNTSVNNKKVYFKLYDQNNNLKDTSTVHFVAPDDTWTGSYETVADSYTPRLFRGRVAGEEGVCKNCHVTHGKLDIYGNTIRASAVAGTSKNLNELCFTCHTNDTQLGSYPGNEIYKRDTHAKTVQLDVYYDKGECANCHDPHGTPYGFLLRYPVNTEEPDANGNSRKNELCFKCHDKPEVLTGTPWFKGSTVYKGVYADHGMYAQWPADQPENRPDFIPGVCLNCHNAHGKDDGTGTETNTRKMLPVGDGEPNRVCYKCHDNSALAQAADLMGNGPFTNRAPGWPTIFNTVDGSVYRAGKTQWDASAHARGGIYPMVWPGIGSYPSLSLFEDGQCINCHDPHGSGNPFGLLASSTQSLCTTCHDSGNTVSAPKIPVSGTNGHRTTTGHSVTEDWSSGTVSNHATCSDCHKPHELRSAVGGNVYGTQRIYGSDGVDQALNKVSPIDTRLQYQLCLKCHAAYGSRTVASLPGTTVSKDVYGTFTTNNASHHGVFARVTNFRGWNGGWGNPYIDAGTLTAKGEAILARASGMPAGWPIIRCDDCHTVHASNNSYGLINTDKAQGLCLECHESTVYTADSTQSAFSQHRKGGDHVGNTRGGASGKCDMCHGGSYGIHGSNVNLPSDGTTATVKFFLTGTYMTGWKNNSSTQGACWTTTCENHSNKTYTRPAY